MTEDAQTLRLGPVGDRIGYHLRRASAVFSTDFTAVMGGSGMRQPLFGILSVIAANPRINQSNVGRLLGIQRANMVTLVTELLDAGLILRHAASDDRRAFSFTLTESGHAALDAALARVRLHEDRLLVGLSQAERQTLITLLGRIESTSD